MKQSRSVYALKNSVISLLMQVIRVLLTFAGRTVFIKVLSAEYLGVNSLFTDILSMLSFAELGIGNAIIFSMYKPIAENDTEKIKSLMKLYARCYNIIGGVIAALGICAIPFLEVIVGDVSYVKENITLLYLLFLFNTVISYFFVYKKSIIIAYQKNYIVEFYQELFLAGQILLQSIFLIMTKKFIIYLLVMLIITFLNNWWVARKANKMYPFIMEHNVKPLAKDEKKSIFKNVKALVIYKIGGIILDGTDSIFISALLNVVTVGLYANYKIIVTAFRAVGAQIANSIRASVGNLLTTDDKENKENVFREMFFIHNWFYGFTAVGLMIFISDVIEIWVGKSFVISFGAVVAVVTYYYVQNMHYPCDIYRTGGGLFTYGKYVPIFCAVLNIILDIALGISFGLSGILWASVISRFFTYEWIDPIIIYRKIFNKGVLKYFQLYFAYTVLTVLIGGVCFGVVRWISYGGILGLIFKCFIVTVLYNVLYLTVTFNTREVKSLFNRIKLIISNKRNN